VCLLRGTNSVFLSVIELKGSCHISSGQLPASYAEPRTRSQVSLCEIYGGQMAVGQVSLPALLLSLAIIILPMLHIHLYLHIVIASRTNGQSPGKFPKGNILPEIGKSRRKVLSLFFFKVFRVILFL